MYNIAEDKCNVIMVNLAIILLLFDLDNYFIILIIFRNLSRFWLKVTLDQPSDSSHKYFSSEWFQTDALYGFLSCVRWLNLVLSAVPDVLIKMMKCGRRIESSSGSIPVERKSSE